MDTRSSTFIMFMIVSYCRRELSVLILIEVTRAAIRGGGVPGLLQYLAADTTHCTLTQHVRWSSNQHLGKEKHDRIDEKSFHACHELLEMQTSYWNVSAVQIKTLKKNP